MSSELFEKIFHQSPELQMQLYLQSTEGACGMVNEAWAQKGKQIKKHHASGIIVPSPAGVCTSHLMVSCTGVTFHRERRFA